MTPERFHQIEEVFDAVADAPAEEQDALLDRLARGDAELRAEVASLLAAAGGATLGIAGAIGRGARHLLHSAALDVPRRLGPYRLEHEIGQGGMGVVYLAVRDDDEYHTRVALKLLRHGLSTSEAVARFRDERQILATLEHPGIVRMLDGGRTAEGLPYLVMEHVEGAPITAWADARTLDVRARVTLFRKVAQAVAYAHQKLVVHRDLKPSNILVTDGGEPKLLDFGIAKLLDPTAGREANTRTGMRLLTPEYASPEQVRGEPVATSSDVYALGAILYELLSGAPAQRIEGEGIEALRSVLEVDPPRPSVVAPAARRRALAGDLDNIVLKALQKEPTRRYASVEQLAEDLERYLDGLPVLARAGTWTYRAGKLVRRNRGALALVGAVLVALSAATVVSVRQARRADEQARRADEQARRAQRRFDEVRGLANAMLFEVDGAIEKLEGATEARELIVRRALEYLDGLAGEAIDDPNLGRELAAAYVKTGDVQGNPFVPNLGRAKDALESYAKARRIVDELVASGHADVATRWVLARALFGAAFVHWTLGERRDSAERGRVALEVVSTLPHDGAYDHRVMARWYSSASITALEDGDAAQMASAVRSLLDTAHRWARDAPSPEATYWIGIAHDNVGEERLLAGDPEASASELDEGLRIFTELSAADPASAPYRRELWLATILKARIFAGRGSSKIWLPRIDDPGTAERALREALSLVEIQVQHDRTDARARSAQLTTLDDLASVVAERDPAAALPLFQQARAVFAGLPEPIRATSYILQFEWLGQCTMAVALARRGRRDESRAATAQGLTIAEHAALARQASFDERMFPSMCRFLGARARHALGDTAEAGTLLDRTEADLRALLAARPSDAAPYVGLVETLELDATIRPDLRRTRLTEAQAVWRSWPGAPTPYAQRRQAALDAAVNACP